jgi:hypothetical protein
MSDDSIVDSAIKYFLLIQAEDAGYCRSMGDGGPSWFVKNSHPTKTLMGRFRKITKDTGDYVFVEPREICLMPQQQKWVACHVYFGLVSHGTQPHFYHVELDSATWIELEDGEKANCEHRDGSALPGER